MKNRLVIGLGGSRITRLPAIVAEINRELGIRADRVFSAWDYEQKSVSGKGSFSPPSDGIDGFDAERFLADLRTLGSGQGEPLVVILGPLSALPAARELCGTVVFVEAEERLSLLRWADLLMDSGADGGAEALYLYASQVAPRYAAWSADAKRIADIVLDDEDGPAALASKIVWFATLPSRSGIPPYGTAARAGQAGTAAAPAPADGPGDARSRLEAARELERRLARARSPDRLGLALRSFIAGRLYPAAKRSLDFGLVSLVLFVAWPIYALVAFLIWTDDPGPVLYVQTRVGRYGKIFRFPKFRSMVLDADKLKDKLLARNEMTGGITFKMKRDPRIIPVGRVIRKYSLDELPQLWSILRGDLTLVGPRPPVPREVALYSSSDRRRLESTPGLTCIWQVSGRSEIPFPRQVELDVEYLERRSLLLDLKILVATIPAVLTGRGAY